MSEYPYRSPHPGPPPAVFWMSPSVGLLAVGLFVLGVEAVSLRVIGLGRAAAGAGIGAAAIGAICLWVVLVAPLRVRVVVSDRVEVLPRPYRARTIAPADVVRIRIADWKADESLAPRIRTFGTGLPGYSVGWFRLKDGRKALIVSKKSRVLCIETPDVVYLLAPDRFEDFVGEVDRRFAKVEA